MHTNNHRPSLRISLSTDKGARMTEDNQLEIEFKEKFDALTKRWQALEITDYFSSIYQKSWKRY